MQSCHSFVAVVALLVFGCVWQSNAEKCKGKLLEPKGKLCTSMNDDLENCANFHAQIMPGVTGQCAVTGGTSCVVQDRCGDFVRGPKSCYDLYKKGKKKSGVYEITPNRKKIKVWCDMTRDGGGWTLVAKLRHGNMKGDPRKKHGEAWCSTHNRDGPCKEVKPGWLENDKWPHEHMAGWLALDDWDAIFNSGKKYFRRDDGHNRRGNYFKRITSKYPASYNNGDKGNLARRFPTLVGKTFRMSRAYWQWDYTLGETKRDFNLVNEYSQIDQHQHSHGCNYADLGHGNHYVGYERDCGARGSWDTGVYNEDCYGDETTANRKGCRGHTHQRHSRILWVK